jgi:D-amino peptidase
MRRQTGVLLLVVLAATLGFAQTSEDLKVHISADMEGISGVVSSDDASRDGKDYDYFRQMMTREVNAAIEGALASGATDIVVRDAHSSARNLVPELLNENALLLRAWSGGAMMMMEGLDESFDAVIFIGYHAKAGTPDAVRAHTFNGGEIVDVSINGISMTEAGINSLIAGYYGVPVVFVAGDRALCEQTKELLGSVETVAVKEGIGNAALCLHPEVARNRIRAGVENALHRLESFQPFVMDPPYTLKITYKRESSAFEGSTFPGAKRSGDWEIAFESDELMEVINALGWLL